MQVGLKKDQLFYITNFEVIKLQHKTTTIFQI